MTLWQLLKPVVAQVHGNCLAGGLELMSMADIVFVADDARLGYPPMRGMSTPDTAIFPWKMTMAQAKYIQITGNSITGKQAAEWGWVVKSFPADDLDAEVGRELHVLRNIDPSIMAANKMATNQAYEIMGIRTHIEQSWVWHYLSNLARVEDARHGDRAGPHDQRVPGVDEPCRERSRAPVAPVGRRSRRLTCGWTEGSSSSPAGARGSGAPSRRASPRKARTS